MGAFSRAIYFCLVSVALGAATSDTDLCTPAPTARTDDCDQFCDVTQTFGTTMNWCAAPLTQTIIEMYNYPTYQDTKVDYWDARDLCPTKTPA